MKTGFESIAYQDGGRFYSAFDDRLIADYSDLVQSDFDLAGAELARAKFIQNHPQFELSRNADIEEY